MTEEEFEGLLREAAQALASNEPDRAEQTALAALRLRPGNPLAQNVVGLSYFGQSRYDQALEVFDSLARRNADVVPLRINAGVAAVRAGDRARAETHLRRAVDLDAGQQRAFAYLAALHLEGGQRKLALAALREAGLSDLVERLGDGDLSDEELAEAVITAAQRIPPAEAADPPWQGFTEIASFGGGVPEPTAADDGAGGEDEEADGADSFANLDAAFAQLDTGPMDGESTGSGSTDSEPSAPSAEDGERPARTTQQRLLALKPPRSAFCFAVFPKVPSGAELDDVELHNAAEEDDRRCLIIGPRAVALGVNVRQDLLVVAHGELQTSVVPQREKGARVGPMAIEGHPVVELRGNGRAVLVTAAAECLEVVRLSDEACCIAESALAAFSSELRWERGCVPGTTLGAYEMVGRGFIGLSCHAPLERVRLRQGEHLKVRSDCLVGWGGGVVPCVSDEAVDHVKHGEPVQLECGGQGVVVLCLAGGGVGGLNAEALQAVAAEEA